MNVNSQYFDKEQIKAGEMQKLLDFLMTESYGAGKYYNDIHIKPADCGAFIVEWVQLPWEHDFGGSFQYVDEDQRVVTEFRLPDGSYIDLEDEEEFNDYLEDWLKDNPGWVKTDYGTWTSEIENKAFQEYFKEELDKWQTEAKEQPVHLENGIPQGE